MSELERPRIKESEVKEPEIRRTVTAALLIIGDEILSGRTEDRNLVYLAGWLNEEGIALSEARVVADDPSAIGSAVNELRGRYDYLFTTGGIGPTHDDITVDSIAAALSLAVEYHPDALAALEAHYGAGNLTEARMRMARIPAGATLIENPVSTAPGIRIGNIIILAGIPGVMRGMLEGLRGQLAGGAKMLSGSVTAYAAESEISIALEAIQRAHPSVKIGSYPFYRGGRAGATLVVRSPSAAEVSEVLEEILAMLKEKGCPLADEQPG